MAASVFFENLEERKAKFWQQCLRCAAHHQEWPRDGVQDFFLHWSAINRIGQMKWETLPFWSTGHRMGSYMKHRRYLESYYAAKLENVRNPGRRGKTTAQLRAEEMEREAQNAYDRYFEEQAAAQSRRQEEEQKNEDKQIDD